MNDLQLVVFKLNNEICGADASQVQEIVKYQSIAGVPGMPDFVEGIINLRGKVVPIVNLNTRFGIGNTEITKKTKIIITQAGNKDIGFIVNDVSEIIKLPEEERETPPDILNRTGNTYLKGVGKRGDQLISILDLGNILRVEELVKLE